MNPTGKEPLLKKYFKAEKQESLFFMIVGLVAFLISLFLLKNNSAYKGAAYPLIAIGLIQVVVGGTVYFRTDNQVKNLLHQLQSNPQQFREAELKRIQQVNKSFVIYRWIEMALMIAGIFLFLQFKSNSLWFSVGIGLTIQAALMLVADLFAEDRGKIYLKHIEKLTL